MGGVVIAGSAWNNLIGTSGRSVDDTGERNVISGNFGREVAIRGSGTSDNVVAGNFIGTDAAGDAALGGSARGFSSPISIRRNWIGVNSNPGPENLDQGNVISGHGVGDGISILDSSDFVVSGNWIGSRLPEFSSLSDAVGMVIKDSSNGLVGGSRPGEGNIIAFNAFGGVVVVGDASKGISIESNSIYGNGGLGIDLGDDGVTPNHSSPTTGIVAGATNGSQNFPDFSAVFENGFFTPNGDMILAGTLQAGPQ